MISPSASARNRSPFTATQWQELEQQALIFKYMVSGAPIPSDLIYSIRISLESAMSSSRLFPLHPIGWGCLEMGYGRKIDPEPGRCRRTDGKKWRCSKEAYPDSKYCEKHMHRGRNRSRKPVEVSSSTTRSISTNTSQTISSSSASSTSYSNRSLTMTNSPNNIPSRTSSFPFSLLPSDSHSYPLPYQNSSLNPLFTRSTCSRPLDSDFPPQNSNTHQLSLDSGSYYGDDKDYRHIHGMKEGVDERAFFPEASGSVRTFPDSYQQLSMSSYKPYSNSQFQNINHNSRPQQHQDQHCYVLGSDFKSPGPIKNENETDEMTQRPLHHFFGEWPPKNTDSWLDLASNSRIPTDE